MITITLTGFKTKEQAIALHFYENFYAKLRKNAY